MKEKDMSIRNAGTVLATVGLLIVLSACAPAATTSTSTSSSDRVIGEYTISSVGDGLVVTVSGDLAGAGVYPKLTNGSCDVLTEPAGASWRGADGVSVTAWKDLGGAKAVAFIRDGEECDGEIDVTAVNTAGKLDIPRGTKTVEG